MGHGVQATTAQTKYERKLQYIYGDIVIWGRKDIFTRPLMWFRTSAEQFRLVRCSGKGEFGDLHISNQTAGWTKLHCSRSSSTALHFIRLAAWRHETCWLQQEFCRWVEVVHHIFQSFLITKNFFRLSAKKCSRWSILGPFRKADSHLVKIHVRSTLWNSPLIGSLGFFLFV